MRGDSSAALAGEGAFAERFITLSANANKFIQTADYQFVQLSLGANADYRIGNTYDHTGDPVLNQHAFPPDLIAQLHFKVGYGFKLTGKLGEVMRESAEIAYSYTMSHLARYHADPAFLDEALIHLHVPEGATPKDGPSAGVTMATALVSLASKRSINRPLAMTGELTLTGQVLPVGGIREKVIAARRIGIRELVLPDANRKDFDELPEYLREGFEVHFARCYDDVYSAVFRTEPAAQ